MPDSKIELIQGDITTLKVDAIVNAANSSLLGGGGVDGAIHRAGGKQILEECRQIRNRQGKCKTREAVITTAGLMPSQYVIHTVGPVWNGGLKNEVSLLTQCYQNSLRLALENDINSIAFPNISTGIYGYPKFEAAQVAIQTVKNFLHENPQTSIERIIFICFDKENYRIYEQILTAQS